MNSFLLIEALMIDYFFNVILVQRHLTEEDLETKKWGYHICSA